MSAPTYCRGCSFKCMATGCECTCHDKIRKYWAKQAKENKTISSDKKDSDGDN